MRIHHIVLYCTAPDASRGWYEAAGFRYLRGYGGMHWLGFDDAVEVMLHPHETGPGPAAPQMYAAVPSLDAHFTACRQRGLSPSHHQVEGALEQPHTTPWGQREFELVDPDGHCWGFVEST